MTAPAVAPKPLIVHPENAADYLSGLGISVRAIYDAVKHGELRAADIDSFHPRGSKGLTRWITVVGELRRAMVSDGPWHKEDHKNRPTCVREDDKVTLSVVGGDADTGIVESLYGPRANHKRGAATAEALSGQFELIEVAALVASGTVPLVTDPAPEGQWFVLYHRAEDSVQIEVSKASGLDADGQFTGWLVRVVLDQLELEATAGRRPEDMGGGDVDFTIIEAS